MYTSPTAQSSPVLDSPVVDSPGDSPFACSSTFCLIVDSHLRILVASGPATDPGGPLCMVRAGDPLCSHPAIPPHLLASYHKAISGERTECTVFLETGTCQVRIDPITDEHGHIFGASGLGFNMSSPPPPQALNDPTAAVNSIDKQVGNLLDSSQDGVFIVNRNFIIQRANRAMHTLEGGENKAPIEGTVCYSRFFGCDSPCPFCPVEETFRTGKPATSRCFHPELGRHFNMYASPMFDLSTGELVGAFETVHDISDQRKYEQELKANRHGLLLLDSIPMCCMLFDEKLRLIDCNQEGIKFLQCINKAEVRAAFFRLFPTQQPDGRLSGEAVRHDLLHAFDQGSLCCEWTYRLRDGSIVPAEVTCIRLSMDEQQFLAVYTRDLRVIKKMEHILAQERAELMLSKEAAENASQIKSSFLSNMSHEIRTPMNAILGLSYIALQRNLHEDENLLFQKIHTAATGLLRLINDILDFSKIEARKLTLEYTSFSLQEELQTLSDMFQIRVAEKGIDLFMHLDRDAAARQKLIGDPARLRQILVNLMGNAVKFTNSGGVLLEIETTEREEDSITLCFSVSDTGIGMSAEALNLLFKPFEQADNTISTRFGGTGLGLAISKELVELMGGHIAVESDFGMGSSFTVTLRFQISEETLPASTNARPSIKSNELPRLRGKRILLVEDNEINQMIAQNILEQVGIIVSLASNGIEALETLEAQHGTNFDLVLMDIQMPLLDGLEATRRIRKMPTIRASLPIIAMTAHAMTEDHTKSREAGMDAHITKPINPDDMFATVLKWI